MNVYFKGKPVLVKNKVLTEKHIVKFKMKISSEDNLAANNSTAGKLVGLMIKILLIPVSPREDGTYQLNICSLRYFFSCILWCVLPTVLTGWILYLDFEMQTNVIMTKGYSFANFATLVFLMIDSLLALLIFCVLPTCGAYLVDQCGSIPLRIIPSRKFQVFMCTALNISQTVLWLITFQGRDLYLNIFSASFVPIQKISSLILINLYTTNFVQKCQDLKTTFNCEVLLNKSKTLSKDYIGLKNGLGPSLLFHYSTSMLVIMYQCYILTTKCNMMIITDILKGIFMIWNITIVSQECFEEIHSANDVLRYKTRLFSIELDKRIEGQIYWILMIRHCELVASLVLILHTSVTIAKLFG